MKFQIEWFDRLASTNLALRDLFYEDTGLKSGRIIAAREQTAGRGRQDRRWLASANQNLCFSLFIETGAQLAAVPSLTMAAALAVNDLLRSMNIRSAPKWPNDVLVEDRKICGILSERVERRHSAEDPPAQTCTGIIVGIGLNVNMTGEEILQIDRPATSILMESGEAADVETTLNRLLDPLDFWIGKWTQGGFSAIRSFWTDMAGPPGKPLTVHDGDIVKCGRLAGFGEHGELQLETDNGVETIWSGDVT